MIAHIPRVLQDQYHIHQFRIDMCHSGFFSCKQQELTLSYATKRNSLTGLKREDEISTFSLVQSLSCVQLFATYGLQHARLPGPSQTARVCSNSCPSSWWCHPTISSSAVPFSSCLQSFAVLWSFPMSQFLASCGQSIGVSASASVLPMNIQGRFPLGLTDLISFQSKGLSRIFSSTTIWKHQFVDYY